MLSYQLYITRPDRKGKYQYVLLCVLHMPWSSLTLGWEYMLVVLVGMIWQLFVTFRITTEQIQLIHQPCVVWTNKNIFLSDFRIFKNLIRKSFLYTNCKDIWKFWRWLTIIFCFVKSIDEILFELLTFWCFNDVL